MKTLKYLFSFMIILAASAAYAQKDQGSASISSLLLPTTRVW
jgi:hypothetical protein